MEGGIIIYMYTRAKPLCEARSAERGDGQGGGFPPPHIERKLKSGNDF